MLTNYERETIINFNEAESTAYIFTYNKKWQTHLESKMGLKPTMKNSSGGREYELNKARIPLPRLPRKLSDATLKKLREGAKRNLVSKPRNASSSPKNSRGKVK
jgi:hypothetical protein